MTDSIGRLVAFFNKFPGIGNKSARRMAFFLLRQEEPFLRAMGNAIAELKDHLFQCGECGNISDSDPCPICKDMLRDRSTLCVVESIDDLASFEQAGIYNGLYHVLGGRVSPLEDQELSEECVDFLLKHIEDTGAREIIIATNPRMEGDLTYYTLLEILKERSTDDGLKISRLAFGLPVGGSIEFADRMTLHTALESRIISK
ncbi:MAG: recombination mediator RecR [Synergistaceae bacterium]|jgi:recombination protein RecR|nr:recombination mediator RecR [Synergistaceae bacterium]